MRSLSKSRAGERGYILLTLLFLAAVLVISLAAVAPLLSQQLRRDREEELVHRGVQYSRAIRRYFKKFGRYPTRLEELENTNNIRFLRQRYKDPITGQDFKILHFGEVQMAFGPGIAGGVAPGANPVGGGQNPAGQPPASAKPPESSTETSPSGSAGPLSSPAGGPGGQVFGGGPIVGVVSTSKKESIREFNKKNHYNQWQFIYDPSTDRGGLLNTPAQPALQGPGTGQQPNPPGVPTLSPRPGGPSPQPENPEPPQ